MVRRCSAVLLGTATALGGVAVLAAPASSASSGPVAVSVVLSGPTAASPGGTVTLSAKVVGAVHAGAATGVVNFSDNGSSLGSASLSAVGARKSRATLSTNALGAGSNVVTASYAGDALHSASTSVGGIDITVAGAPAVVTAATAAAPIGGSLTPTAATITSSLNPSFFGDAVSYQVIVTSGGGTPKGLVQFYSNGKKLKGKWLHHGTTTLTTDMVGLGMQTVRAEYRGNAVFAPTTAKLTQTVNQAQTTTVLTATPTALVVGQGVKLHATVTAGALKISNSKVTFFADGTKLGPSVPVKKGQATLMTAKEPLGATQLTASFAGGMGLSPSTSLPVAITVHPDAVASSASPAGVLLVDPVALTSTYVPAHAQGNMSPIRGEATNPTGRKVYTIAQTSNNLVLYNQADASTTLIPLAFSPQSAHARVMAISNNGHRIFISVYSNLNPAADALIAVSAVSKSVLFTIPLPGAPVGLAYSNWNLLVSYTDAGGAHVAVMSPINGTIRTTVNLGVGTTAGAVALTGSTGGGNHGYVLVSSGSGSSLAVLNVSPSQLTTVVTSVPVAANAVDVVASPDGSKLYVDNSGGSVQVFSAASPYTLLATIPVSGTPAGMAISPDGTTLFVAAGSVIDVVNTAEDSVSTAPGNGSTTVFAGPAANS